jgi:hypothetical protein
MTSETAPYPRPAARDVAIRALILKHVVSLGIAVAKKAEIKPPKTLVAFQEHCLLAARPYMEQWHVGEGIFLTSTNEAELEQGWRTAVDRIVHFQVVLWALGLLETLPPADQEGDLSLADIEAIEAPSFLPWARLRSAEAIDLAGRLYDLWHWRGHMAFLQTSGAAFPETEETRSIGVRSFDDAFRWVATEHHAIGLLPAPIRDDFPAFNRAFLDLSEEERVLVGSIVLRRRNVFDWLRGRIRVDDWDWVSAE